MNAFINAYAYACEFVLLFAYKPKSSKQCSNTFFSKQIEKKKNKHFALCGSLNFMIIIFSTCYDLACLYCIMVANSYTHALHTLLFLLFADA